MVKLNRRVALVALVLTTMLVATATASAADKYVALGDSYSSGTGTRTYFDSGCQKSNYALSEVDCGRTARTAALTFSACSGRQDRRRPREQPGGRR